MTAATRARDAGIKQAVTHAEQVHLGWTDKAVEAIRVYARCVKARNESFTAELIRSSIIGGCVPTPPHLRSWGHAMREAAKKGYIQKVGIAQSLAPRSHMSYVSEWRAAP